MSITVRDGAHRRRDRHVHLDGHATRTGHRPSTRTWATGPAPRAPSSASTRGDRPRRRRPDLRGHGPPGRPLDQPGHRAHQRHDRLRRGRLEPVQRERHRPRRPHRRRDRHVHLDGQQHEPGTGLRPEPGRPDQRRGRRHQPRRRGDRPRRRRPDLRGHGPPGRPLDQPGHRAHQRHDRLRRGRLEPVQRERSPSATGPPSTRPTRSPGRSATRTGHRPSTRTWATGPAPRAPSSASTPGRPTPTATP